MKKLVAGMLSLIMILSLVGCMKALPEGTYRLTECTANGATIKEGDVGFDKVSSMYIKVKSGSILEYNNTMSTGDCKYEYEGDKLTVHFIDGDGRGTVDGDKITLRIKSGSGEAIMVFEK